MEPAPHGGASQRPVRLAHPFDVVRVSSDVVLAGGGLWRLGGTARALVDADVALLAGGDLEPLRPLIEAGVVTPRFRPPAGADVRALVDVVIPVRDDAAGLARLLAALEGWSVLVVDDGSRDPVAIARAARDAGARLIPLPASRGPAAARNAGARAATRPLVWFLDADVLVGDAEAVARRLASHLGDPRVLAVAPRVRGPGGPRRRDRFEARHSPLDLGPRGGVVRPGGPVPYVPSACLLVRRAQAGGFDERLRVGEDVDWAWRRTDAGARVRYDADVTVGHPARATAREWWRQRVAYAASSGALGERHGARVAPLRLGPSTPLVAALLLARPGWAALEAAALAWAGGRGDAGRSLAGSARVVARAARGAGPAARALVRWVGPALLVGGLRRRGAAIWLLGTLWRFVDAPGQLGDLPLAVADDLAAALGRWRGAARARRWAPVVPATRRPVRASVG